MSSHSVPRGASAILLLIFMATFVSMPMTAQTVVAGPTTYSSSVISSNGNLSAWGYDQYLHLVGTSLSAPPAIPALVDSTPVTIAFPSGVTSWTTVANGQTHSAALGNDGNLYTWGLNNYGQLGNGTNASDSIPVMVTKPLGVTSWTAVAAGAFHTLAIGNDGNIYSWGYNNFGQLGDSTKTNANTPVSVKMPSGVTATAVAAGNNCSLFLGNNGNLYSWGRNANGQLGIGNTTDKLTPTPITLPGGVSSWTKVAAGNFFNVAMGSDGNFYAWGQNTNGQIGDASTTQRTAPVKVTMPSSVTSWTGAVSCGASFVLAVANNDSLYAWGYNGTGELGIATGLSNNSTPLKVNLPGGIGATAVGAGHNHSLVLGTDGYYYSWGRSNEGELGFNSTTGNGTSAAVTITRVFGLVPYAPEVPTLGLPANNATSQPTSLTLKWTKSPNASGYQCQVSLDGTFATNVVVNDSTLTDTLDAVTGLGTSTMYFWRVRSYNNGVLSAFSSVATFTTAVAAPATPTIVSPTNNAINEPAKEILICNSAFGASQYHWQVSADLAFSTYVVNDSTTDTTRMITLTSGTKYYWQVQAVNPGGVSAFAGPDSFTVMTAPSTSPVPAIPGHNATNQRADTLVFKWSSIAAASGYECQISLNPAFAVLASAKDSTADTTFTLTGLQNFTMYYWRVRAYNVGGGAAFSSPDSFTTIIAAPARPHLVLPGYASINVPRKTLLTWNVSLTATSYHLQITTSSSFTAMVVDTSVADTALQLSSSLAATTAYSWRVSASNVGGTSAYSTAGLFTTGTLDAVDEVSALPKEFALLTNYPNPFNPSTNIKYDLPEAQNVSLKVYNILGQEVAMLVNGRQNAGYYEVTFNADRLGSGVYFYVLRAGTFTSVHKMVLLK
jgi:alpha-tubulin suppressor-like RCC1 family protein